MPDLRPRLFASDLEGVLVPEIWIAFAEKTGIEQLRLTTRDISDYDQLMQMRLKILKERNLRLQDIEEVIATIAPLPGAGTIRRLDSRPHTDRHSFRHLLRVCQTLNGQTRLPDNILSLSGS